MENLSAYIFILMGLLFLLGGGHFLVSSSVGIALKYKVSTMVVGLTLVSFATSAPELLVSVIAAFNDHPDIALGNVVGSNIANVGLILGLTALLFTLPVSGKAYRKDYYFLVAITFLVYFMLWSGYTIYWYEGLFLVVILVLFNIYKIRKAKNIDVSVLEREIDFKAAELPLWRLIAELALGVVGLYYGAGFLVDGAVDIALDYGISQRVVSVSIVALGTSLPELVASVVAAKKGEKDLAVGNVIGSNIFNILGVIGFTSIVSDIRVADEKILEFDFLWVIGFTIVLYPLAVLFKKNSLGKPSGVILFAGYLTYMLILAITKGG